MREQQLIAVTGLTELQLQSRDVSGQLRRDVSIGDRGGVEYGLDGASGVAEGAIPVAEVSGSFSIAFSETVLFSDSLFCGASLFCVASAFSPLSSKLPPPGN